MSSMDMSSMDLLHFILMSCSRGRLSFLEYIPSLNFPEHLRSIFSKFNRLFPPKFGSASHQTFTHSGTCKYTYCALILSFKILGTPFFTFEPGTTDNAASRTMLFNESHARFSLLSKFLAISTGMQMALATGPDSKYIDCFSLEWIVLGTWSKSALSGYRKVVLFLVLKS